MPWGGVPVPYTTLTRDWVFGTVKRTKLGGFCSNGYGKRQRPAVRLLKLIATCKARFIVDLVVTTSYSVSTGL